MHPPASFAACCWLAAMIGGLTWGPDGWAAEPLAPGAMTARIDAFLRARWSAAGVEPAPRTDDAEFLRRAYLDLTGVIPPVAVVRSFLADPAADKRLRLIDRLLNSPAHATHLAATWRRILLPRGFEPQELENALGLENWLRQQFADNLRYDNLVAEFLVAQGDGRTGPALYYTSLQVKPEKLAASTASIFLGLQIQCAECHDHPFDRWTQRDFWGYAAFFAQLERPAGDEPMPPARVRDLDSGEVRLPGREEVVPPQFPAGKPAPTDDIGTRRSRLAVWMASRDNPYLPRAAANWAWAHLFGRGLVHPIDDHGPHNPPSHPELLDELSEFLVQHDFDLRLLLRTIACTEAYQLSSAASETPPALELFARMLPKTLPPELLYDCIQRAAHAAPPDSASDRNQPRRLRDPQRFEFVSRMDATLRDASDYQAGLPQALLLMNGPFLDAAVTPERSDLLQALSARFFSDGQRVETVFLAALCRQPTEEENSACLEHLRAAATERERQAALGDVLWALLNSAEFCLNH